MSTPILCNNEEITLQKERVDTLARRVDIETKQKNWYYRSLKPTILNWWM